MQTRLFHLYPHRSRHGLRISGGFGGCGSINSGQVTFRVQDHFGLLRLVDDEETTAKQLLDHGDPRASVRQELTELLIIPGPALPHPISAGSLGLQHLLHSFFWCAFFHAHPGQVNREALLWLVALQTVHNVATSMPLRKKKLQCYEMLLKET